MNIFAVISIVTFIAVVNGGPVSVDLSINSNILGDHLYFSDTSATLYSREDALSYCQSQGAELAKITNKLLFDTMRLSLSKQGTYWIDGIDKSTHERFELNNNCTLGETDFSEMPPESLVFTPKQCLALVKGTTAADSRIQPIDCIIPNRVLCSYPLNGGCPLPTSPPVTATTQPVTATTQPVTTTTTRVTTTTTPVTTTTKPVTTTTARIV